MDKRTWADEVDEWDFNMEIDFNNLDHLAMEEEVDEEENERDVNTPNLQDGEVDISKIEERLWQALEAGKCLINTDPVEHVRDVYISQSDLKIDLIDDALIIESESLDFFNRTYRFLPHQVSKVKHEMTLSYFGESEKAFNSDIEFKRKLPMVDDGYNNKTPDAIKINEDRTRFFVFEFGTKDTDNYYQLDSYFREKMRAYSRATQNRHAALQEELVKSGSSDLVASGLFVLIVGRSHVCSNIPNLTNQEIDQLIAFFHTSAYIEELFRVERRLIKEGEESVEEKIVDSTLKMFDFPEKGLTREYTDSVLTDPDPVQVGKVIDHALKQAMTRAVDSMAIDSSCQISKFKKTWKGKRTDPKHICKFPGLLIKLRSEVREEELNKSEKLTNQLSESSCLDYQEHLAHVNNLKNDDSYPELHDFKDESLNCGPLFDCYREIWADSDKKIGGYNFGEDLYKLEQNAMTTGLAINGLVHKEIKEWKKLKNRFSAGLSMNQRDIFGTMGVQGKSMKNSTYVKDIRKRQKGRDNCFSLDCHTEDIDMFVSEYDWLNESREPIPKTSDYLKLIDRSLKIYKIKQGSSPAFQKFKTTNIAHMLNFHTNVAQELSLAFNKFCKPDEFIRSKLRSYDVDLIIKPTNVKGHLFYCMRIKKSDILFYDSNTVFRKLMFDEDFVYTEWTSFTPDKLENSLKAFGLIGALFCYQQDFFCTPLLELLANQNTRSRAWSNLALCLLFLWDDKEKSEEVMTLNRYSMMEFMSVNHFLPPNPFKILTKIPSCCSSRLPIWLIGRMIETKSAMLQNNPKKVEVDSNTLKGSESVRDKWIYLIHPVLNYPLKSMKQLVNIFYIGYLKNKNAHSFANSSHKLISKIVEEEYRSKRTQPEFLGWEEPPVGQYNNHEFSIEVVKTMADALNEKLKDDLISRNIKPILSRLVKSRLAMMRFNKIATVKATSKMSDIPQDTDSQSANSPRGKLIAEVLKFLDTITDSAHPFQQVYQMFQSLNQRARGIITDIFKKLQHAGLREIYVMTLASRMCQLSIETLARCLCELTSKEMMTHPYLKNKHVADHYKKRSQFEGKKLTLGNSDDAKRWNQNFMVNSFYILLVRVMDVEFHPFLASIMNLWLNRHIGIPKEMRSIMGSTLTKLYNEPHMNQFHQDWLSGRGVFRQVGMKKDRFIVQTGFMQGILHYVSSIFHCAYLEFFEIVAKLQLDRWYNRMRKIKTKKATEKDGTDVLIENQECCGESVCDFTIIMTSFASSDDSAMLVSVIKDKITKLDGLFLSTICFLKNTLMEPANMLCSYEKSTIAKSYILEFNSEWYILGSLVKPEVKHIFTACDVFEAESYPGRFDVQAGLLTQIRESSVSGHTTFEICKIQAHQHYLTLGMFINPLFSKMCDLMIENIDDRKGFFFMDHPLLSGLMPFNARQYWASSDPSYSATLKAIFLTNRMVKEGNLQQDFGKLERAIRIEMCSRSHWLNMLRTNDINPDEIRQKLNKNPEILYLGAKFSKINDVKLEIQRKLISGEMASVFSVAGSVRRVYGAAIYAITGHCYSTRSMDVLSSDLSGLKAIYRGGNKIFCAVEKKSIVSIDPNDHRNMRFSLLSLLSDKPTKLEITKKELSFLFPSRMSYDSVLDSVVNLDKARYIKQNHYRTQKINVVFPMKENYLDIPLETLIRSFWFMERRKINMTAMEEAWNEYSVMIPWLRKNIEETLELSPFEYHVQLHDYVTSLKQSRRTLKIIGPPCQKLLFDEKIRDLVKKTHIPGMTMILEDSEEEGTKTRLEAHKEVLHQVSAIFFGPNSNCEKTKKIYDYLCNPNTRTVSSSIAEFDQLEANEKPVAIIQEFCRRNYNLSFSMMNRVNEFSMGTFTKRQNFDESGKRVGIGIYMYKSGQCILKMIIRDSIVKKILCNSLSLLSDESFILRKIMEKMSWFFPPNLDTWEKYDQLIDSLGNLSEIPTDKPCIPVEQDKELFYPLERIDYNKLSLMVNFPDNIRLVKTVLPDKVKNIDVRELLSQRCYPSGTEDMRKFDCTLFSFRPRAWWFRPVDKIDSSTNISNIWISGTISSKEQIDSIILLLKEDNRLRSAEIDEITDNYGHGRIPHSLYIRSKTMKNRIKQNIEVLGWMKLSLSSTLKFRGLFNEKLQESQGVKFEGSEKASTTYKSVSAFMRGEGLFDNFFSLNDQDLEVLKSISDTTKKPDLKLSNQLDNFEPTVKEVDCMSEMSFDEFEEYPDVNHADIDEEEALELELLMGRPDAKDPFKEPADFQFADGVGEKFPFPSHNIFWSEVVTLMGRRGVRGENLKSLEPLSGVLETIRKNVFGVKDTRSCKLLEMELIN